MHFIVHKSLKEHHKSPFSFKKIRNVHFDFMLTLMSQVSRSGVQADRGTMDGLNLWSWAFGFSSSVSAGNKDLVSNFLSCSHSIPSFPIDLDLYPIFFTSCPFFSLSPFPSNKLLSNTFSLSRRWSTSVIWTVTWCVFCWGGPSGMCALLTTSSGVSSTLIIIKNPVPLYRAHVLRNQVILVCALTFKMCLYKLMRFDSLYLMRWAYQHHECMIIFIHIKVMHM